MQENTIKTVLLITNLFLWATGWAVLAMAVHLMSGENGRHFSNILLGGDRPPDGPTSINDELPASFDDEHAIYKSSSFVTNHVEVLATKLPMDSNEINYSFDGSNDSSSSSSSSIPSSGKIIDTGSGKVPAGSSSTSITNINNTNNVVNIIKRTTTTSSSSTSDSTTSSSSSTSGSATSSSSSTSDSTTSSSSSTSGSTSTSSSSTSGRASTSSSSTSGSNNSSESSIVTAGRDTDWRAKYINSPAGIEVEAALLVLGSIIVMAGLVGCIAASQSDRTLLLGYCCIMIAVGVGDGGTGVWCLTSACLSLAEAPLAPEYPVESSSSLEPIDDGPLQRLRLWYGSSEYPAYTQALDALQEQHSCCGLTGPSDYDSSYWHRVYSPGLSVLPSSCCHRQPEMPSEFSKYELPTNAECEDPSSSPHPRGCLEVLPALVRWDDILIGSILLIISMLQIFGATATLLLRKYVKSMSCREMPPIETLLF